MTGIFRRALHRYLPADFENPLGLATRLLKTGDPAARFAMLTAGMGVAAIPLDMLLTSFERKRIREAPQRTQPLIFVCGAPRSGTTLVYQTLVEHLPVGYFSNLSAVFPRSPLTAHRLLHRLMRAPRGTYQNFYGKTATLSGTNDALYLWDRWLGGDRSQIPVEIAPQRQAAMREFFAAAADVFKAPIVNKNNSLNLSAHLVANCLENVHFICLNRSRYQLAQSLYRARCDIHGTPQANYGAATGNDSQDAVQSVCEQVLYHEANNLRQEDRLGERVFWNVRYEEFCHNPAELVQRIASEILRQPEAVRGHVPARFAVSQSQRVSDGVAAALRHKLPNSDGG